MKRTAFPQGCSVVLQHTPQLLLLYNHQRVERCFHPREEEDYRDLVLNLVPNDHMLLLPLLQAHKGGNKEMLRAAVVKIAKCVWVALCLSWRENKFQLPLVKHSPKVCISYRHLRLSSIASGTITANHSEAFEYENYGIQILDGIIIYLNSVL